MKNDSTLFNKLFYFRMIKRIKNLKQSTNDVDYPDDVIRKNPLKWNTKYIKELYEWSVNGARSRNAISHLSVVTNTIFGIRLLLFIVAVFVFCWLIKNN